MLLLTTAIRYGRPTASSDSSTRRRDTLGSGCIASGSTASWPVIRESGPVHQYSGSLRITRPRRLPAMRFANTRSCRPSSSASNRSPDSPVEIASSTSGLRCTKLASAAVRCADAKSSDIASRTLPDSGGPHTDVTASSISSRMRTA